MAEYKVSLLEGLTSVGSELVTEDVDEDIEALVEVYDIIEEIGEMEEFEIDFQRFDYLKAGLMFYRDELAKAQKRVKTKGLDKEIGEIDRILSLGFIAEAKEEIYHKYKKLLTHDSAELPRDVNQLIETIHQFNVFSENIFNCKIFKNDGMTLRRLQGITRNESEFVVRLATIGSLLNDINTDEIKKRITKSDVIGSLNLIEALFTERNIDYDKNAIKSLRQLYSLRSKKEPIHSGEHEAVQILRTIGISYPVNWTEAGQVCLQLLTSALGTLAMNLAEHNVERG